jgi:hypothetical protein
MSDSNESVVPDAVCIGCPAAYALERFTETTQAQLASPHSTLRDSMQLHESAVAAQTLNRVAGKLACASKQKHLPELPPVVPEIGSSELIQLVARCPSFPTYLHERTGQSIRMTKLAFRLSRIVTLCSNIF